MEASIRLTDLRLIFIACDLAAVNKSGADDLPLELLPFCLVDFDGGAGCLFAFGLDGNCLGFCGEEEDDDEEEEDDDDDDVEEEEGDEEEEEEEEACC
jgi:hypothetical protein